MLKTCLFWPNILKIAHMHVDSALRITFHALRVVLRICGFLAYDL